MGNHAGSIQIRCVLRLSFSKNQIGPALANNNPVVLGKGIRVESNETQLMVSREDGTLIFKAEQLQPDQSFRPSDGPLKDFFEQNPVAVSPRNINNSRIVPARPCISALTGKTKPFFGPPPGRLSAFA